MFKEDLRFAVKSGNTERVQELLKNGDDPNPKGDYSPLLGLACSATAPKIEIIQHLLGYKANPNFGLKEYSPLHFACKNKKMTTTILELLLSNKANVNKKTRDSFYKETPLHLVCSSEEINNEFIKLLCEYKADPNICDESQCSSLHILCQKEKSTFPAIKIMLTHKADPNSKDGHIYNQVRSTPLSSACLYKLDLNIILLLLMHASESTIINIKSVTTITPTNSSREKVLDLCIQIINAKKSPQEFLRDFFDLTVIKNGLWLIKNLNIQNKSIFPKPIGFEIIKRLKPLGFFQGGYKNPQPAMLGTMVEGHFSSLIRALEDYIENVNKERQEIQDKRCNLF